MFLISYRSEYMGYVVYGFVVEKDPIEWLIKANSQPKDRYVILNVLPLTEDQTNYLHETIG